MKMLLISEAAKKLECHPETVRRLDRRGVLKARRDYRNFRVFDLADVMKVKEERELLRNVEGEQH